MAVNDSFRSFVLEQLQQATRDVRWKRMFGAVGVYSGELFFAVIDNDTLYFKTDEETRPAFEAEGMAPFMPYGPDSGASNSYYTVPVGVLESPEDLRRWVKDAVAAAARKKTTKRTRKAKR